MWDEIRKEESEMRCVEDAFVYIYNIVWFVPVAQEFFRGVLSPIVLLKRVSYFEWDAKLRCSQIDAMLKKNKYVRALRG